MNYTLGLDLGTTYTAAAVCRAGHCEISPLGNRSAVIPSVVHLAADGGVLVGEAAQRRLTIDPSRVAREFKRRIGDPTPVLLGGSPIAAEALTARLARAVVANVSEREGGPPERVTVTHPASWGPFKQDLMRQAMRMADLTDVSFLSEPEAAAWEYAASRPVASGATIAVYDLGGGTFDATLLRAGERGFSVLGEPEGIERFGGIDIDQAVFAFVVEALGGAVEALDPDDPLAVSGLARLRADCAEAKEALSSDHEASIPVVLPTLQTEVRITRPELEALIRPVMGDTVAAMRRALASAGVAAHELSAVLLVGGSSRIPLVAEYVSEMLGRPVAVDAHPKHLVAMGAARHAAAAGHLSDLSGPSVSSGSTPASPATPAASASPIGAAPVAPADAPVDTPAAPPESPIASARDTAPASVGTPTPVPSATVPSATVPNAPVPEPPVTPTSSRPADPSPAAVIDVAAARASTPRPPTSPAPTAPTAPAPSPSDPVAPAAATGSAAASASSATSAAATAATAPSATSATSATSAAPAPRSGGGSGGASGRGSGGKRVGLLVGVAAVAIAAIVGAVVVLGGGGGGGGDDGGEAAAAADACPSSGPFVCITDVAAAGGGGVVATFRPVGVTPGANGATLVFFLADVASTDHGVSVVTAGAPLGWNSSDPFSGWTDAELASRSVVCAGVVQGGSFVQGSGNCAALP